MSDNRFRLPPPPLPPVLPATSFVSAASVHPPQNVQLTEPVLNAEADQNSASDGPLDNDFQLNVQKETRFEVNGNVVGDTENEQVNENGLHDIGETLNGEEDIIEVLSQTRNSCSVQNVTQMHEEKTQNGMTETFGNTNDSDMRDSEDDVFLQNAKKRRLSTPTNQLSNRIDSFDSGVVNCSLPFNDEGVSLVDTERIENEKKWHNEFFAEQTSDLRVRIERIKQSLLLDQASFKENAFDALYTVMEKSQSVGEKHRRKCEAANASLHPLRREIVAENTALEVLCSIVNPTCEQLNEAVLKKEYLQNLQTELASKEKEKQKAIAESFAQKNLVIKEAWGKLQDNSLKSFTTYQQNVAYKQKTIRELEAKIVKLGEKAGGKM